MTLTYFVLYLHEQLSSSQKLVFLLKHFEFNLYLLKYKKKRLLLMHQCLKVSVVSFKWQNEDFCHLVLHSLLDFQIYSFNSFTSYNYLLSAYRNSIEFFCAKEGLDIVFCLSEDFIKVLRSEAAIQRCS